MRLLPSNHNDVTRPGLSLLVITTWHEKELYEAIIFQSEFKRRMRNIFLVSND